MIRRKSLQLAAILLGSALVLPPVLLAAEKDNMMKGDKTGAMKDEKGKMAKDNMKSEKDQAKKSGDKMKKDKMEDKKM
jgi:pentapeptide MXKDX repeat protein